VIPREDLNGFDVADFDNDQRLDLIVGTRFQFVAVLRGNGDGTFQPAIESVVTQGIEALVTADWNGDAMVDIAVAAWADTVSIRLGNGNGGFFHEPRQSTPSQPQDAHVADFNRDGILDVAMSINRSGDKPRSGTSIRLGRGDGTFRPARDYGPTCAFVVGDWNGDAILDLACPLHRALNENSIGTLLGNGNGTFRTGPESPTPGLEYIEEIVAGDFDEDGIADQVLSAHTPGSPSWYGIVVAAGTGTGSFLEGPLIRTPEGSGARNLATGDFNRDGHLDLAFTEYARPQDEYDLHIFAGDGGGGLVLSGSYAVGRHPQDVASADLNGDGWLDLVTSNSDSVLVLLGDGMGDFHQAVAYHGRNGSVVLADFTGDGRLDVAVADGYSNDVAILPGRGDGTLSLLDVGFGTDDGPSMAAGDFDRDGRTDLVTANYTSATISILINVTPIGPSRR
jgi:hypothetical protein